MFVLIFYELVSCGWVHFSMPRKKNHAKYNFIRMKRHEHTCGLKSDLSHAVPHYDVLYCCALDFNRLKWRFSLHSSPKNHPRLLFNLKRVQFLFQNISLINYNFFFFACSHLSLCIFLRSIFRTFAHMLLSNCSTLRNHMLSHCKQLWWWV